MRSEKILLDVLAKVRAGKISKNKAARALSGFPSRELEFANIDCARHARCGFPEAVYCEGKTVEQIRRISREILKCDGFLLLTRLAESSYKKIKRSFPHLKYNKLGRVAYCRKALAPAWKNKNRKVILIITAGTSDIPVAEEAKATLLAVGANVRTLYDVGVAGIHRVLNKVDELREANVIIVAAGMDGALASVVGGIVSKPVIAVPTSCGYGASFKGLAALLTMLNSCAPGVSVVNIDNGFGAAYIANMINNMNLK
ncbi:MAG: nickel pincer cofactor biosynthesis protein LarB [Candidatus Omnitrophica bacterium]|nr:nickel pincer cofactor biosynthesis protein LarB [Candidatus Omnitrophota bacterium]MBU4488034.1 nickel pincer cofactor biosynthesis protein LarB [Candidatus Omnitrophota bacterium]MCG2704724.1 nickel pincer cofactor biosynthesis protein LarB [Candidatus Omnitrophota bacterium]